MRTLFLLTLVICLAYPISPLRSDEVSIPFHSEFVIDREDQISNDTKYFLHFLLQLHQQETSYRVTVATLPSTSDLPIEVFSDRLVQQWGYGKGGKPEGAVLVFIPRDKLVGIGVSSGLKDVLTDRHAKQIIDEYIRPNIRQNDIQKGMSRGAREITHVLSGKPIGFDFKSTDEQRNESFYWLIGLTVFGMSALVVLRLFGGGWTDFDELARNYSIERHRDSVWGGGGADFNPVIQSLAPPPEFTADDDRAEDKDTKT